MKIVQIENRKVHWITPYASWDDAPPFAPNVLLIEASDDVCEGWLYDAVTGTAIRPPDPEPTPVMLPEITNAEVVQQINDLCANLIVAGVIKV